MWSILCLWSHRLSQLGMYLSMDYMVPSFQGQFHMLWNSDNSRNSHLVWQQIWCCHKRPSNWLTCNVSRTSVTNIMIFWHFVVLNKKSPTASRVFSKSAYSITWPPPLVLQGSWQKYQPVLWGLSRHSWGQDGMTVTWGCTGLPTAGEQWDSSGDLSILKTHLELPNRLSCHLAGSLLKVAQMINILRYSCRV